MLAPGQTTVLRSPPDDGITSLSFAPNSDRLLLSSWDGTVRLYDTRTDSQEQLHETSAPALDASFALDDTKGFVGCVDGKLYLLDFKGNELSLLGSHQKGVKSVEYCNSTGVTVSGGWDRKMKLWDPRSSSPLTASCNIKGKVFNLSVSGYRVVVATSERHVTIYDVRKTDKPEQDRLSSLQHQLRTVRCFPDGTGYAVGSVEGRIAIEYFDPSPAVQAKKYAFKCHRKTDNDGVQTLYPVNALAFNPVYGTFASGGCDGAVCIWDGMAKKRICQYPSCNTSVAALSFNKNGNLLAIAQSYTFENGQKDHPSDAVVIRAVRDTEVKPKPRKK